MEGSGHIHDANESLHELVGRELRKDYKGIPITTSKGVREGVSPIHLWGALAKPGYEAKLHVAHRVTLVTTCSSQCNAGDYM